MAEYYLVSQLPSLDGISENVPLPITEQRFWELCGNFLGKKTQCEMEKLTLVPAKESERSTSALVEAWNEGERNLRFALAKVRANRMNKTFDLQNKSLPVDLIRAANTAAEMESPLDAEIFLFNYRLKFLESLRPMDSFSEDFLFYYGLKLKLLWRIRQFDANLGESEYKKIYDSVLSGDNLEVIQ